MLSTWDIIIFLGQKTFVGLTCRLRISRIDITELKDRKETARLRPTSPLSMGASCHHLRANA